MNLVVNPECHSTVKLDHSTSAISKVGKVDPVPAQLGMPLNTKSMNHVSEALQAKKSGHELSLVLG